MAVILPSTYTDGTAVCTNGSPNVVGTGTMWLNTILPGDFFWSPSGESVRVLQVVDDTHITLAYNWPGETQATGPYEIRFQSDQGRVQETTRQLLERMQSGNLYAFAGLAGMTDLIPYFTGPGAMGLLSKAELVNGVNFDVQVDTLADRAAYDTQITGYTVLVSDTGDGRSAIYSKVSATSGDWSDPAYLTGPAGLNWRGVWNNATVYVEDDAVSYNGASYIALTGNTNVTPVAGATWGVLATRGATGATGVNPRGTYNAATAYLVTDSVLYNGSTWIATANTTGNAPPNLPTTSNAWWQLLAQKGTDGTGIGDVVGPSGATDSNAAMFDGTTGKLIKQFTNAQFRTWLAQTAASVSFSNSVANLPGNPATVQTAIEAIGNSGGKNDALFALEIADLKGQRMGMIGGVADSFDDQTGIVTTGIGGIDGYTGVALHLDGANGSTTITDSAFSGRAWTAANGAQISTTKSKFGGASLYCGASGSGGYIQSTTFADLAFGTGDFTIDMWFNADAITTSHFFVDMRSADNQAAVCLYIAGGKVALYVSGANIITGATTLATNTWYHLALVRSSGTTRLYLNGVLDGSVADATNYVANNVVIGNLYSKLSANNLPGYIDEFRITKGVARWTANFTPPAVAYNVVGGIDTNSTTVLHLDSSSGTSIVDSSLSPKTWLTSAGFSISSAQSKFGGSSALSTGAANSFLYSDAIANDWAFGTGDFTAEMWIRPSTLADAILWESRSASATNNPVFYLTSAGKIIYQITGVTRITSTVTIAVNTWYHIAVCRVAGTTRLFINGVLDGTFAGDTTSVVAAGRAIIGNNYPGNSGFTGYIDEVRVSNVARYTTNFTPWNVAFFVETSGSSNFVYDATNDWFTPSTSAPPTLQPAFTANTTSGWTVSSNLDNATQAYLAVDGVSTTFYGTATWTSGVSYFRLQAPSAQTIASYMMRPRSDDATRMPTAFRLQGSNDGSAWTTIDTRTGITWVANTPQTFSLSSAATYTYYQIILDAGNTANFQMGEMALYGPAGFNNMTLVSVNYTAQSTPSTARVAVQLADSLTLTPNTDFSMEVSRDGGNTLSTVTLALTMATFGGVKMYEGTVSLSGQPTGTTMVWRFKTLTNKNIIASGVVLQQS